LVVASDQRISFKKIAEPFALSGGSEMAFINGTNGSDTLIGTSNDDTINGGNGDDTLFGALGNDTLSGGNGEDVLAGGDGNDKLSGGNGDDTLDGDAGNDTLSGDNGDDTLNGGAGNDTLIGGNGDDTLTGSDGNDFLFGSNGDDTLDGGAGTDSVYGESGNDVAIYVMSENTDETDFYDGGKGTDKLRLVLTQAQYNSAAVQSDIQAFQAFLALHSKAGSSDGPTFHFTAFNLSARNFEQLQIVIVQDQNQTPTDISLSNATIAENSTTGTVIGVLSATDPDAGDTFTFTLLDDAGGLFAIEGSDLVVAGVLDFETSNSHQVTVRVTDQNGAFYDEIFTIEVTDVDGIISVGVDGKENTLIGTAEADTLLGGDSNDSLFGNDGNDFLEGGDGDDLLDGGAGNDHLIGDSGNGNDILIGGTGDDILEGGAGNDTLTGGAGNDTLKGESGFDRAVYTDATGPVTVDLAGGTASGAGVDSDTLIGIEIIRGSAFDDKYVATGFNGSSFVPGIVGGSNEFEGMAGDDTITGNGLTRISYASATAGVQVDLFAGIATGDASVGTDIFTGVTRVTGSSFDDILLGGFTADEIFNGTPRSIEAFSGGAGNDFINGFGGNDQAQYNLDPAVTAGITVDLALGIVTGDASVGIDTLRSIENVSGTKFDDFFDATGFSGSSINAGSSGTFNTFEGMGGDDFIIGNGFTVISYQRATAGVTVDLLAGTAFGDASVGADIFTGVTRIQGSDFADILLGNGASNIIVGNAGDDYIDGGENTGGGLGVGDRVSYMNATAGIHVLLADGIVTGDASVGTDTLNSVEGVIGSNFDDIYDATGFSGSSINASSVGNHNFATNGEFNQVEGMGGNDTIIGNGFTELNFFSATGGVIVDFVTGIVTGNASVGTDKFSGVNAVGASPFNDTLIGDDARNFLSGRDGNDIIFGGGGDDSIFGDGDNPAIVHGSDVLVGGTGNDQLFGGGGDDTFVFADGDGDDFIRSFTGGFVAGAGTDDRIDLTGVSNTSNFAELLTRAFQDGDDTVIDFGGGDSIRLEDVQLGDLHEDDFLFANLIVGDETPNVLVGTAGRDLIQGLGQPFNTNDVLEGLGGNDILEGGLGMDRAVYTTATGPLSVDLAAGIVTADGVGTDTLQSVEIVSGTQFDDFFDATGFSGTSTNAGSGPLSAVTSAPSNRNLNIFEGMGGDDIIVGNGNTVISYESATTGVMVDLAAGTAIESMGTDTIVGGVNRVRGSNFDDTLFGSNPAGVSEFFDGRAGDDFIDGRGGTDVALYASDPAVTSGISVDLAAGIVIGDASVGTDTLRSVEQVQMTVFNDIYDATGFSGSSTNAGSNGTFNIVEGRGGDDLIIGNGNTRVAYYNAEGAVTVDLATGASGHISIGTDTFVSGVNGVFATSFDDILVGTNENNFFEGRHGDDYIDGGGGFDTAIFANLDPDAATGVVVNLANGTATSGELGTDTLISIEAVQGTALADDITGDDNNNTLQGLNGDDILVGAGGNDNLQGGNGNDTITGGADNDTLNGGAGNDTFIFADGDGSDTIQGFVAGACSDDVIDLTGVSSVHELADVLALASDNGTNTTINFGGGDSITLQNVLVGQLHEDDFLFV
jgi:Ca2+-binding RTX toxin-like protein